MPSTARLLSSALVIEPCESFHSEIDQPIGNRRRHHANVFRAFFDELANEM